MKACRTGKFRPVILAILLLASLNVFANTLQSQGLPNFFTPSEKINKSRLWAVSSIQVVGFSSTLIALDQLWYQGYRRSSFNLHNDLDDWMQMDKLGHATTVYHLSRLSATSFRWSGLDNRRSTWYGALSGAAFLTVVEVLDGLSTGWGFSLADISANTLGGATFVSQQLLWQEQRIQWKYSFHPSGLAKHRPELLGTAYPEYLIKDYNGMTYWLSANLYSLSGEKEFFPRWLNLAVGHGAHGMLGSLYNPSEIDGRPLPYHPRYRQWYLAPDIDWQRIPTNSPFLKTLFSTLNVLKVPAPAIEYNRVEGFKFHLIFF